MMGYPLYGRVHEEGQMSAGDEQMRVSVVVPAYDAADHLAECLDSALGQSLDGVEVICIDDGSTDGTVELARRYERRYPGSFRLIEGGHQGAGPARNKGIDAAEGEFIAFLDADDAYPSPCVLETLYEAAVQGGVSVAGGSFARFRSKFGNREMLPPLPEFRFSKASIVSYRDFQQDFYYQRFLYEREMLDENGIRFPPYLRYQDPPFFVRAMVAAERFAAVPIDAYLYRVEDKEVLWTSEKVIGLISGVSDVAALARQHGLDELFMGNARRMVGYWDRVVLPYVAKSQDEEAADAFLSVAAEMMAEASRLSPSKREELQALFVEQAVARERLLQDALAGVRQEVSEAYASKTWKVGRAMTLLPRLLTGRR